MVASSHAVKKPQPKILQQNQHTRLKSDELTTKRIKEVVALQAASVVQSQKGKVGKILKNNFVESATTGAQEGI